MMKISKRDVLGGLLMLVGGSIAAGVYYIAPNNTHGIMAGFLILIAGLALWQPRP